MSAVRFAPWVGTQTQYATDGFRGLRVLVVFESHYGDCRYERPDVTPEIIKALALGLRHKHTGQVWSASALRQDIRSGEQSLDGRLFQPSKTQRLLGEGGLL